MLNNRRIYYQSDTCPNILVLSFRQAIHDMQTYSSQITSIDYMKMRPVKTLIVHNQATELNSLEFLNSLETERYNNHNHNQVYQRHLMLTGYQQSVQSKQGDTSNTDRLFIRSICHVFVIVERLKLNNKAHNILCGLTIGHISDSKITGGATAPPAPPVSWGLQLCDYYY